MNKIIAISILMYCCVTLKLAQSITDQGLNITTIPTPYGTFVPTNTYWDAETRRLYTVDLFAKNVFCYSYDEKKLYTLTIDGVNNPAIFLPLNNTNNKFLASSDDHAFIVEWDGNSTDVQMGETVFTVPQGSNVDSASVGPNGKVYVGNFGPQYCLESARFSYYGLSESHDLEEYGNGFITSVGGVLIEKENIYYHMDTCGKKLSAFTCDPTTGALSNQRHVMDLDYPYILPVGLTADTNGFLYFGKYNGSAIGKINPKTAEVVETYDMPTPLVLFPIFGGPDNDMMFVTTGALPMNFKNNRVLARHTDIPSGHILQIEGLGATGIPALRPAL